MFLNYIKIAIRVFSRNKLFSLINVFGLSVGMASSIILFLYVDYEFSYDEHITDSERVFEICYKGRAGQLFASTFGPVAPYLKENYPEIESFTRISEPNWEKRIIVNVEEKAFAETRCYLVDSAFFRIFDSQLVSGSFSLFSTNRDVVILSETTALKYFNTVDIIGHSIVLNEENSLVVIGVIKDTPPNSHFVFDLLIPISWVDDLFTYADLSAWSASNRYCTYIKLTRNSRIDDLSQKLIDDLPNMDEEISENFRSIFFEPLNKIHTDNIQGNYEKNSELSYLYVYLGIALIILVIACINFMNLLTTAYLNRVREIGLRKVLGANRIKIKIQFLSESVFITSIALFLAIIIIESALPVVNQFQDSAISLEYLNSKFILFIVIITLFVGLVSGTYPAFFISNVNPGLILKTGFKAEKSNLYIKNALVLFQFIITITLIIISTFFYLQMKYVQSVDVGYDRKNLIIIPTYTESLAASVTELKRLIKQNPDIVGVTANSFLPSDHGFYQSIWYEGEPFRYSKMMSHISVDEDFFSTYQIKLLQGSNFIKNEKGANQDYILNESAVKDLGWTENPIGKRISIDGPENSGRVIGIVEDVNFKSLHNEITPCLFYADKKYLDHSYLSIRVDDHKIETSLEFLKAKWQEINPKYPFEYFFADDDFNSMYLIDIRAGQLVSLFSAISIILSCLGVLGLVAYSAQQRTKEISIRKVFGASVKKILFMMTIDYTKWVLLANLIAWPIAYIVIEEWLQKFHYRINMHWWVFVLAGIFVLIITLLIISFQIIKTANANPAENLKIE